jgi:cbb3-type cytochrome oxidase subunit 3
MKSTFLSQLFTDTPITVIGLILFLIAFVALFAWVYFRKGAKAHYVKMSLLALENDQGDL